MAVGASEAGIAIKLFEPAKRQGWLDRLVSSFKKRHRILVLGCTGVGKSQFVESLTEAMPAAIDRLNRTEFAQKHSIKIARRRSSSLIHRGKECIGNAGGLRFGKRSRSPLPGSLTWSPTAFMRAARGRTGRSMGVNRMRSFSLLAAKMRSPLCASGSHHRKPGHG